ncbi:hypothetical protein [Undibacterium curvum]|uniref:hypothetical protein n=1 Tax=Undibacterium curvum TaxID=2762294 RepID=UPI003D0D9A37
MTTTTSQFITLAAAREANRDSFDNAIHTALREAADAVGRNVVIRALSPVTSSLQERKAA